MIIILTFSETIFLINLVNFSFNFYLPFFTFI